MGRPLGDLYDALGAFEDVQSASLEIAEFATPDVNRDGRKGVPEVILAEGKRRDDVIAIARHFVSATGRALISRVDDQLLERLRAEFSGFAIDVHSICGMVVIREHGREVPRTGGKVGIVTAGTSDVPVAEQCKVVAVEMGCEVVVAYDVGVAGIHRLFRPLKAMIDTGVDVVIVAAGMDGALPSVVAGLVEVPVIGLPTSVGYGLGGKGVSALLSMLQTCSPGLTVVNIDNGVGAGATAALIANRVAKARSGRHAC